MTHRIILSTRRALIFNDLKSFLNGIFFIINIIKSDYGTETG